MLPERSLIRRPRRKREHHGSAAVLAETEDVMHVSDLAHTCGDMARGLAHAYVKGCESICVVHEPLAEPTEAKLGTPGDGKPKVRAPMETDAYHLVPRIF